MSNNNRDSDENDDPVAIRSNLLPNPWASLVSLATATSSLSLSLGGFLGGAALTAARIGTLSSLELGRVVLEGIVTRAGRDVVKCSRGELGRDSAGGLTERTLALLHFSITQTSFLVSSGFQIGSTGLSSGLALANGFLTALNGILGDTDTSKAVAAIIMLIQREYKSPDGANPKERLSLGDILVAVVSLALLQRWCEETIDREFKESGGEETVWDIVVVGDSKNKWTSLPVEYSANDEGNKAELNALHQPFSFVSATGDQTLFEGFPNDDGSSFVSASSARPLSSRGTTGNAMEESFRQQLMEQIEPGSSVHLASYSVSTDIISVEVCGSVATYLDPPPGYSLIAYEGPNQARPDVHRFVFKSTNKRRRKGTFEIPSVPIRRSSLEVVPAEWDARRGMSIAPSTERDEYLPEDAPKEWQDSSLHPFRPVTANESRLRIPSPRRSERNSAEPFREETAEPPALDQPEARRAGKKSLRKSIKQSASVKNLVDFWSRDKSPPLRSTRNLNGGQRQLGRASTQSASWKRQDAPLSLSRFDDSAEVHDRHACSSASNHAAHLDLYSQATSLKRPRGHRRGSSSTYSLRSEASSALVPYSSHREISQEHVAAYLYRVGELPGAFPARPLAENLFRYSRFSLASYGSTFLRLAGTATPESDPLMNEDEANLAEHHTFSTYTGLPSSTVLLSSFVDPQGGTNAAGETESGMPLVHYISLDHESKAVVVTIRGTFGYEDVLTDIQCDDDELLWNGHTFRVHKGILASSRRILTMHGGRVLATTKAALEEFEDYGLVLCGHSLGGAVASVLAILLAKPDQRTGGGPVRYVTCSNGESEHSTPTGAGPMFSLPPRQIHAYAYGPAACLSPALQRATTGLITTVVHSKDVVPFLSLGTLHNCQAAAIALKTDTDDAKGELRRRVWNRLTNVIQDKTGFGGIMQPEWSLDREGDVWPLAALKSLRASMQNPQLVPPGEVFIVQSSPVLAKHAFVEPKLSSNGKTMAKTDAADRSYRPADHVQLIHVRDVEGKFRDIKIGASMFTDHLPGKYEGVLALLQRGVCC